uniref:Velvet domain-containing protein n=1 Tax=Kwoniella dejecticola CBS 10117 TaxID=1296121 RepID=A0A1A6AFW8_9TREE|nr:uncharacterized protein I303_00792 [Kwoniella dejecticola CBS 10117]OBR88972.1 hypothetical protein I303_00792 [Kwoniella dejecticola CBS 10117]
MYPPPPPSRLGKSGAGSSSSSSGSGSASASSSSRLTTNSVLQNRPPSSSPLTHNVISHDHATGESSISDTSAVPVATDDIDWVFTPPVLVQHGMFEGRYLRFALAVAQEPVLGRRKTEKDRRPLGPAPIVRFRAVEKKRRKSGGSGTGSEEEIDPSSIEPSHLICAAELGPPTERPTVTRPPGSTGSSSQPQEQEISGKQDAEDGDVPMIDGEEESTLEFMKPAPPAITSSSFEFGRGSGPTSTLHDMLSKERESNVRSGSGSASGSGSQTTIGAKASRSASGSTTGVRNLYGNLHVAGVRVPAPEGGMGTWFLFTDLSVRQEGTYSLRFRCFDLTAISTDDGAPAPCLVEAQSQPFRVYSPRQVPPLPKPTELAEHFARQGFKLNTRKNERTASSPPASSSSMPPPPFVPGTKHNEEEQERPGITPLQDQAGDGEVVGGSSTSTSGKSQGSQGSGSIRTAGGSGSIGSIGTLSGGSYQSFEEIAKKK